MLINALNVIPIIIALNNIMKIILDNAFARLDIMMIMQMIFANNVLFFGNVLFIYLMMI